MRDPRGWVLAALVVLAVAVVFAQDRIPQDPAFHGLADDRTLLGIPNALDVLSNLPFLVVGLWGFAATSRLTPGTLKPAWFVFCAGVSLVSAGSAWYHLAPDNSTLFWDRLPIAAAFMALFAMVVHDRVSVRLGRGLLWPAVVAGVGTVLYWHASELRGAGDLRAYVLVQGVPLLLIPVILVLYRQGAMRAAPMWATLAAYGLAKLAERWDEPIYHASAGVISGHTLKHLLAALAVAFAIAAFTAPQGVPARTRKNR